MSSNIVDTQMYETVMNTIRSWPAAQRFTLVQDVLATLAPDVAAAQPHQPTVARALGLLTTETPAPSDEDIAMLLDQRRQERYGL